MRNGPPLAALREAPVPSSSSNTRAESPQGPPVSSVPRLRPHDAHVVLQLLEEIQRLAAPGQVLATESPRLSAAAKLYLDTRDTFEAIEQKVEEHLPERPKLLRKLSMHDSADRDSLGRPSARGSPRAGATAVAAVHTADPMADDTVIDRIQDMFRYLGEQLGPAILLELTRRKLSVPAILHYARFLPADCQWEAYKRARAEQVALAYASEQQRMPETHVLKHHAEFIKEHIRRDVDTVCLFAADGTLSTIFGDDVKADKEHVADKFEALVTDVYSSYLRSIIDAQMEHLTRVSDHWQQQMAASRTPEPPFAQYFARARKYRSKANIFSKCMFTLEDRLAGLPPLLPGQALHIFVADLQHLGLWWQKLALSVTERDVSTVHTDERRGIAGRVESLDGHIYLPIAADSSSDTTRRQWKTEALAKWVGQSVLVNNGKDSLWLEVRVKDVDEKKCKLELKKSLERCPDLGSWEQFLALDEWVAIRDLRFLPVPLNPSFRFHMGRKFRDVLDVIQSVVVEVSSIFPNDELNRKVANALWRSVEPSVSKGEHIYARYLRSTLNQDVLPRRIVHTRRERSSSANASSSVRNLVAAFENSAFGSGAGSLSPPTLSPPASGVTVSGARGVPSGNLVAGGHFDGHGRYYRQQAPMRATPSGLSLSVFEKLAHHLLEETEVVGVCLQASNLALSRAFVQVFHERITKLLRSLQARFEREETSRLEFVLAEYANSCLFLYVWRICRHELDTVPRLARSKKDSSNMHIEWLDRTFERMDKLILDILHQQLHFAHRAFFHECSCYFLPGIYEQAWGASKPWFGNSRCTYGVQFFITRLQRLMEYTCDKLLPMYERALAVHDKLHDLTMWMLLDALPCLASSYEALVVSRARAVQWKMDIVYLVCGTHKLLRLLDRMVTPRIAAADDKSKRRRTWTVALFLSSCSGLSDVAKDCELTACLMPSKCSGGGSARDLPSASRVRRDPLGASRDRPRRCHEEDRVQGVRAADRRHRRTRAPRQRDHDLAEPRLDGRVGWRA